MQSRSSSEPFDHQTNHADFSRVFANSSHLPPKQVARNKTTWNCAFRNGVVTVAGEEYCFKSATAKFTWG